MHSTSDHTRQKETGAYYTPPAAVAALVKWAARRVSDRLLDPSCGDGRFIALHRRSVGVEQEAKSSQTARERAPGSLIHEGDFFTWATRTTEGTVTLIVLGRKGPHGFPFRRPHSHFPIH